MITINYHNNRMHGYMRAVTAKEIQDIKGRINRLLYATMKPLEYKMKVEGKKIIISNLKTPTRDRENPLTFNERKAVADIIDKHHKTYLKDIYYTIKTT